MMTYKSEIKVDFQIINKVYLITKHSIQCLQWRKNKYYQSGFSWSKFDVHKRVKLHVL